MYIMCNAFIGKTFNICFLLLAVIQLQQFLKELEIASTVMQLEVTSLLGT